MQMALEHACAAMPFVRNTRKARDRACNKCKKILHLLLCFAHFLYNEAVFMLKLKNNDTKGEVLRSSIFGLFACYGEGQKPSRSHCALCFSRTSNYTKCWILYWFKYGETVGGFQLLLNHTKSLHFVSSLHAPIMRGARACKRVNWNGAR